MGNLDFGVVVVRGLCVLLLSGWGWAVDPGPANPPTRGAVWPRPKHQVFYDHYYTFDPSEFEVQITGHNCSLLSDAIRRYSYVYRGLPELAARAGGQAGGSASTPAPAPPAPALRRLRVVLHAPCEDYPHPDMDESYNLTVAATAELSAPALWGALRGLETLSHLFYLTDDLQAVRINGTVIRDAPRYPHRGLLVDTARHFLPLPTLLHTLDAMALNKMNVLHWHIVDDQSFPYESQLFPDLSRLGAYHSSLVYSAEDVQTVVQHARARGIRVVPEFDVPGHTRSWGEAYPQLLTECYRGGRPEGLGPMHPLRNHTYKLLGGLLGEVRTRFPDRYLHFGGDEVDLNCWSSNPELAEYMRAHNMSDARRLHALFMARALQLRGNATPVFWQEVFDEGVWLPGDTVVQVWKSWENSAYKMAEILRAGYRVLFSANWYLDQMQSTFEYLLETDPRELLAGLVDEEQLRRVIGGEACMWGELVDDTNFFSRVWPRASAVAERLWSPTEGRREWGRQQQGGRRHTLARAEELACRMRRRGLPAAPPGGPGYCVL